MVFLGGIILGRSLTLQLLGGKRGILELIADYIGVYQGKQLRILRGLNKFRMEVWLLKKNETKIDDTEQSLLLMAL